MAQLNGKWNDAWEDKAFKRELVSSLLLLLTVAWAFSHLLAYIEYRAGYVNYDPLLAMFAPADVSLITFYFTYLPVLLGLGYAVRFPLLVLRLTQGYTLLLLLRMITLYAVPLAPPVSIIPLDDPLLQWTVYSGRANLNDLFFSGHTATLFLLFLIAEHKWLKRIFLVCTFILAALLLLQHVHYTADVLAAPFFAWAAERNTGFLKKAILGWTGD